MADNFNVGIVFNAVDNTSKAIDGVSSKLNKMSLSIRGVSEKMSSLGRSAFMKMTLPLTILGGISLRNFNQQEKAIAQVRIGLETTGGAAKRTLEQLKKSAEELQETTLFGDEAILSGVTSQLLTFTNITGKEFDRTQKSVLDVATRLAAAKGGAVDLTSTAIQLGKALNDPVKNLSALSRSGIQFTEKQTKVIKYLTETNRIGIAQKVILKELERQYGGSAEAAAKAGTGGLTQLKNVLGDLTEVIGEQLYKILSPYIEKLKKLTKTIQEFIKNNPEILKMAVAIAAVAAAIGPLLIAFSSLGFAIIGLKFIFASLALVTLPMLGTFALVTLGIVTLISAITALVIYWDEVKAFFIGIGNVIKDYTMPYINELTEDLTDLMRLIKETLGISTEIESPKFKNAPQDVTIQKRFLPDFINSKISPTIPMSMQDNLINKNQTEVSVKLSVPKGMNATVSDVRNKGKGTKVNFIANSDLGDTQMTPWLR